MAIDSNQLLGQSLGACTLQRLLGQGGMGAVYLAQQSRPRRTVAVKVLLPDLLPKSLGYIEFLVRFRREADAIATLDHVNIMPIYEYGEQEQLAYLVMPYVAGGTLREVLVKRGILPLDETVSIIEQVAAALDYAHAHGIIHRDLKPGNILFHADGRLLLADFGIAKVLTESSPDAPQALPTLTATGAIIGTPEYLSPEQAAGNPVDQRSDVYALGVVLFQMLGGRVPFTGTTPVATAIKHALDIPPPLSRLNPAIPRSVEEVVAKALAKRPEQRYATAGELAQALRMAAIGVQATQLSGSIKEETLDKKTPVVLMSTGTAAKTPVASSDETVPGSIPLTPPVPATRAPIASDDETIPGSVPLTPPVQEELSNAPTVLATHPQQRQRKREGNRPLVPLWIGIVSVILVLLIVGVSVLYLRGLPGGNRASSGSGATPQPTALATHTPTLTSTSVPVVLPPPAVSAGKLLYGTALPACGSQSTLWSKNPYAQLTCEAADTRLTDKGTSTGNVAGVFLGSLPGGAPVPNDYVLQVQVKVNPSSRSVFGIFFRVQTGANHQGKYSFLIQTSGYWNGYTYDDPTGQATSLFGRPGIALNANGFTTIDIIVQGSNFMIYYNGAKQGGISSGNYSTGSLGLAADVGTDVSFKNFALYALP